MAVVGRGDATLGGAVPAADAAQHVLERRVGGVEKKPGAAMGGDDGGAASGRRKTARRWRGWRAGVLAPAFEAGPVFRVGGVGAGGADGAAVLRCVGGEGGEPCVGGRRRRPRTLQALYPAPPDGGFTAPVHVFRTTLIFPLLSSVTVLASSRLEIPPSDRNPWSRSSSEMWCCRSTP